MTEKSKDIEVERIEKVKWEIDPSNARMHDDSKCNANAYIRLNGVKYCTGCGGIVG